MKTHQQYVSGQSYHFHVGKKNTGTPLTFLMTYPTKYEWLVWFGIFGGTLIITLGGTPLQNGASSFDVASKTFQSYANPVNSQYFFAPSLYDMSSLDYQETAKKIQNIKSMTENYLKNNSQIGNERGILLVGYDSNIIELVGAVGYIRQFSDIPIEIAFANDLKLSYQDVLKNYKDVDLLNVANHPLYKKREGYQFFVKVLAMIITHFNQVIYLDADSFPLFHINLNVTDLAFELLGNNDMLLFRDLWMHRPESSMYKYLKMKYSPARQVDSGVIVYKKSLNVMKQLLYTFHMSDDRHFDRYSWGDKDLFWFSAMILRDEDIVILLLFNPTAVGTLGTDACGIGHVHFYNQIPIFAHINQVKTKHPSLCDIKNPKNSVLNIKMDSVFVPISRNKDTIDDYSQVYHYENQCITCVNINGNPLQLPFDPTIMQQQLIHAIQVLQLSVCP